MMEQLIRLRIEELTASEWRSSFQAEITEAQLDDSVKVVDEKEISSLPTLDPHIIAAMIQGGAAIIAAVIGVVIAHILRIKSEKSKEPRTVLVTLRGSADSVQIPVKSTAPISADELQPSLDNIGQLREISFSIEE